MTGADYEQRSRARLGHLKDSLDRETARWEEAAAEPDQPLEKHRSQVACLTRLLRTSLSDLSRLPDSELAEPILDLHHVWDFFRSKLVLRCLPQYQEFLDTADELAWACYRPALEAAGLPSSVPPLVFLSRDAVPFTLARGSDYRGLLPSGVRTRPGADAVRRLPFPIIGVPWHQTEHLPDVLAVAHEVGHHIEDDCELTEALRARLLASGLPTGRQPVWEGWLGEVFADVCACLACGPAYVATLSDALVTAPATAVGAYPPKDVRLAVCHAVFASPGPGPSDEPGTVVRALMSDGYAELGDRDLPTVLQCHGALDTGLAVGNLLAGMPSSVGDVREALAAAADAFGQNPDVYDSLGVQSRVIREVLKGRPRGPRAAGPVPPSAAERAVDVGHVLAGLLSASAQDQQVVSQ
ncbi:hypothetical protein ABZZ79_32015 [Streptomyces sp. NPDC006458]|uniref:hypothetical protein n=1 Tax=Streptomyces sp. NPDC006458 TaxID=3154302 RepID=UPI00339EE36E